METWHWKITWPTSQETVVFQEHIEVVHYFFIVGGLLRTLKGFSSSISSIQKAFAK